MPRSAGSIGSSTRVIELRGRTVTPGFQDAHVHPVHGGLYLLRCELHDHMDAESYIRIIGEYVAANPDLPWIRGGGWYMAAFPGGAPRRDILDRLVADRPAMLESRDGHSAWVNTRALEVGGHHGSDAGPG